MSESRCVGAIAAVIAGMVCAACASDEPARPKLAPLPAEVVDAVEARAAALQTRITELNAQDAVLDLSAWVPRPDLGACPTKLPRPYYAGNTEDGDFPAPFALQILAEGTNEQPRPAAVLAGRVHRAMSELATARQTEPSSDEARTAHIEDLRARVAAAMPDVAVVFAVDHWQEATFNLHAAGAAFEPGTVTGRAYLWSASRGTVICAAEVVATSSASLSLPMPDNNSVDVHYGRNDRTEIRAALDLDLRKRVEVAIAEAVQHAAGPPATAEVAAPDKPAGRRR